MNKEVFLKSFKSAFVSATVFLFHHVIIFSVWRLSVLTFLSLFKNGEQDLKGQGSEHTVCN